MGHTDRSSAGDLGVGKDCMITLAARFLSLGVLWSCRISLLVSNGGTQTSWRSQIGQGAPEVPPQRRLGGKVNCDRGRLLEELSQGVLVPLIYGMICV